MYCSHCGKQIDDRAVICVNCGVPTKNYNRVAAPTGGRSNSALSYSAKNAGITSLVIAILSLFLGFITLLPAVGTAFGMISITKQRKGNWYAAVGIIINAAVLIAYVIFFLLGIISVFTD